MQYILWNILVIVKRQYDFLYLMFFRDRRDTCLGVEIVI